MKKKITLYLPNETFDGLVKISESTGWQFSGLLFSCFRNNLDELVKEQEELKRNGVYILLSDEKIYIGQTTDLLKRIKQHNDKKEWWDRVIILTSETNKLNGSDIIYLESELIKRATMCGTLECENSTNGNFTNIDQDQIDLLDEYLDEAYALMKFLGISAFEKKSRKKNSASSIVKEKSSTETTEKNTLKIETREDACLLLEKNGLELKSTPSYSKLESKTAFHLEPRSTHLENDFYIVLNNMIERRISVLLIPKNTFTYSNDKNGESFVLRKSNTKRLQMYIEPGTYIDRKSGIDLSKFVIKELEY